MRFQPRIVRRAPTDEGSRLRLIVTAVNSFLQKIYCSGGVVADETAKDARACHVQIPRRRHPSTIQLPLTRGSRLTKIKKLDGQEIRVGILFGGRSAEHGSSLQSRKTSSTPSTRTNTNLS